MHTLCKSLNHICILLFWKFKIFGIYIFLFILDLQTGQFRDMSSCRSSLYTVDSEYTQSIFLLTSPIKFIFFLMFLTEPDLQNGERKKKNKHRKCLHKKQNKKHSVKLRQIPRTFLMQAKIHHSVALYTISDH